MSPHQKIDPSDIIRIEEASLITGLKVSSIYVKVCKGEIPHFKQFGKLFFSRTELVNMISSGRRLTSFEHNLLIDSQFKVSTQPK